SLSFTEYNTSFKLTVTKSLSIGDEEMNKPSIVLFPNPNKGDNLSIRINNNLEKQVASLSILDMAGRSVLYQDVNLNSQDELLNINISNLNKGIYFVVINTGMWSERMKFIVE
ncbi:MAG: T9SS type A sorting domain-containing protein, partial [Flavobacteriales bacterium]|nr:T9SS type A sorting domain-containing protein [Flavobacteriales bacterium]